MADHRIPAPGYILSRIQDPQTEPHFPRYIYISGDPYDIDNRKILEVLVPLTKHDCIWLAEDEKSEPECKKIAKIEYREIDLKGLGDLNFVPCLVFED